jgi:hypothetical protein
VTCDRFGGLPISSTNKTDCHDITKILLKVALNTIKPISIPKFLSIIAMYYFVLFMLF